MQRSAGNLFDLAEVKVRTCFIAILSMLYSVTCSKGVFHRRKAPFLVES